MSRNHKGDSESDQPLPTVKGFIDERQQKWVQVTNKGKKGLVKYDSFVTDRNIVWLSLAQQGVHLFSNGAKAAVIEQVDRLEFFTPRIIFSRQGWTGGQFAYPTGKVFAAKGSKQGWVAFPSETIRCRRAGTHQEWLEQIVHSLKGHPIPSFFLMVAFAAPLLELVGRTENFGFELAGMPGTGKSTTQRLMASTVGPVTKDRGYITSFNMTPAAFERSMHRHSDMPFIIDEANLFGAGDVTRGDWRKMQDFAFQMASGVTKGRYATPEQEGFRFVFVTSANKSFVELLGQAHRDIADAAMDRLMTISIPNDDAGVWGTLPDGFVSYRTFTLELEAAMERHYGTAMPKFLRRLVEERHRDEGRLRARIREKIDRFKAEIGVNDNNGSDVRVAEAFGLVYAAGCAARHYGVLPNDFDCLGAALHCYGNFRNTVPMRQSLSDRVRAIAAAPETRVIDRKHLPELTDAEVAQIGAFTRQLKGENVLLMTPAFGARKFSDWNALRGTPEFVALNRANKGGRDRGLPCTIRRDKTEWFYCFRIPD